MIDQLKQEAQQRIDAISDKLFAFADELFANPEYNFNEFKACKAMTALLEDLGFSVEVGVGGVETALRATYDSEKPGPHIGIFGEFDAVPGMGHACGHNLMAAMAVGAGEGLRQVLDQLCGKVSVFATPAEEGGGGKIIMLDNGAFSDLDAAMILHSANETVVNDISYSRTDIIVNFYGKQAHAATWPEEGISALDPILMLFQYINAMRLRWNGQGTILGIISKGGDAPIYIPEHCQAKFTIRSFDMKYKLKLLKELLATCEHLAEATGTRFTYENDGLSYEDIRNNTVLERLLFDNFTALGEQVMPRRRELGIGCTDMGNITHEIPALQSYVKVIDDLRGHTKEFEEACGGPLGHKAILTGAKAMAMSVIDLLAEPKNVEAMKEAFQEMKKRYE